MGPADILVVMLSQSCPMFFESLFLSHDNSHYKVLSGPLRMKSFYLRFFVPARQAINRSLCEQVSSTRFCLLIALLAYFMRLISLLDRNLELPQVPLMPGRAVGVEYQEFS